MDKYHFSCHICKKEFAWEFGQTLPVCEKCLRNKDHWTFSDDPEKEPRPGWGPFKFDWLMKPFTPFVEWHDKVTTINSTAQKAGITNKQIVEYTRKQLELVADKPRNGFEKRLAWGVGFLLSKVNRFFYEGPL